MKLLRAAVIAPMDRPPIRDGGILVEGEVIQDVGDAAALAREHPRVQIVDLGEALVTPGLINAHTHLELSDAPRPAQPGTFVEWLLALIRDRIALGEGITAAAATAAARGAAESLRFGVTCVGDITRFAPATRGVLAASPLRVVSYGEVQAMAGRRYLLAERLREATDLAYDDWGGAARILVGVSPHAPYSVEPEAFAACLRWAVEHQRPLTTHLAETPWEAPFLAEHAGPFRELWAALGDWTEDVPCFSGGPVRLAQELGLLDQPSLLAHVNCVDDSELDLLARGRASVVWCPRTHAFFGRPPHRFREMLGRGIRVCLGTDSCASAPDLNVLEEARAVRRMHPELDALELWQMITRRAAEALGVGESVGAISRGRWADFAVWPLLDESAPLEVVLQDRCLPKQTWIAGQRINGATASPAGEGVSE